MDNKKITIIAFEKKNTFWFDFSCQRQIIDMQAIRPGSFIHKYNITIQYKCIKHFNQM